MLLAACAAAAMRCAALRCDVMRATVTSPRVPHRGQQDGTTTDRTSNTQARTSKQASKQSRQSKRSRRNPLPLPLSPPLPKHFVACKLQRGIAADRSPPRSPLNSAATPTIHQQSSDVSSSNTCLGGGVVHACLPFACLALGLRHNTVRSRLHISSYVCICRFRCSVEMGRMGWDGMWISLGRMGRGGGWDRVR